VDCSLPVAGGLAFVRLPQSVWLARFLFPLIEPDRQISPPALGKDTRLMVVRKRVRRLQLLNQAGG